MQAIEERGLVRQDEESLPTREELSERRSRYPGLTRPELAVVTAFTKINLTRRLERSPLVDDAYLVDRFLNPYFPPSIVERFADDIAHHRLRRELVATRLVNELVDVMGSIFIFTMVRDHGVQAPDAIRAWIIAGDIIDLRGRAEKLRAHDFLMTAEAEISAFLALERAAASASDWALRHCDPEVAIGAAVEKFRPTFQNLSGAFESMLVATERERFERIYRELRATVNEEELALSLARLAFADHLLERHGAEPCPRSRGRQNRAGVLRTERGDRFRDDRSRAFADLVGRPLGAARRARAGRGAEARADRADRIRPGDRRDGGLEAALERLKTERPRQFMPRRRGLIAEARTTSTMTLAALQVVVRSISRLAGEA